MEWLANVDLYSESREKMKEKNSLEQSMPRWAKEGLMKEKKPYEKFLLGNKIKALGKFTWSLLVLYSFIVVVLFLITTSFSFWVYISRLHPEIFLPIYQMLKVVSVAISLIVINHIVKLIYHLMTGYYNEK